jgi:arsenite-transporting ATPase
VFSSHVFWGLPLMQQEVRGSDCLLALWEKARLLKPVTPDMSVVISSMAGKNSTSEREFVRNPALLPASSIKFLLFAGKGGVGKTTLACASALRLAQEHSGKEILLFSIDPAHSLAVCLNCQVGPQETRVAPGLSVIELDAQAEYERLKREYVTEVTEVFDRVKGQSGTELAFDREVMEKMLDVAPPGLDEMLALTHIVDLMDGGQYDYFVLDTAPTGHFIRFLEMPELIEAWLKTFFSLFLKYREIFWLPKISQLMVDLSKKMKVFRRMLTDARQAALMAVSIPTEMAYAETGDLVAACLRLGTAVPVLFVNLVIPTSTCPNCSVLSRTQEPVLGRFLAESVDRHTTLVFRQDEPQGIERLRALGRDLYVVPSSNALQT